MGMSSRWPTTRCRGAGQLADLHPVPAPRADQRHEFMMPAASSSSPSSCRWCTSTTRSRSRLRSSTWPVMMLEDRPRSTSASRRPTGSTRCARPCPRTGEAAAHRRDDMAGSAPASSPPPPSHPPPPKKTNKKKNKTKQNKTKQNKTKQNKKSQNMRRLPSATLRAAAAAALGRLCGGFRDRVSPHTPHHPTTPPDRSRRVRRRGRRWGRPR